LKKKDIQRWFQLSRQGLEEKKRGRQAKRVGWEVFLVWKEKFEENQAILNFLTLFWLKRTQKSFEKMKKVTDPYENP